MKEGTKGKILIFSERKLTMQMLSQQIGGGWGVEGEDFFLLDVIVIAKQTDEKGNKLYVMPEHITSKFINWIKRSKGFYLMGDFTNGENGFLKDCLGWYSDYELESEFEATENYLKNK
jgi:hypothetical protein